MYKKGDACAKLNLFLSWGRSEGFQVWYLEKMNIHEHWMWVTGFNSFSDLTSFFLLVSSAPPSVMQVCKLLRYNYLNLQKLMFFISHSASFFVIINNLIGLDTFFCKLMYLFFTHYVQICTNFLNSLSHRFAAAVKKNYRTKQAHWLNELNSPNTMYHDLSVSCGSILHPSTFGICK